MKSTLRYDKGELFIYSVKSSIYITDDSATYDVEKSFLKTIAGIYNLWRDLIGSRTDLETDQMQQIIATNLKVDIGDWGGVSIVDINKFLNNYNELRSPTKLSDKLK